MNIERSTIYFTHLFEPNQIFYFCRLFPHFADLFWMPIVYFMNNQNDQRQLHDRIDKLNQIVKLI